MSTYVQISKLDTTPVILEISFLSRLVVGETVVAAVSSVTVTSGVDTQGLLVLVGLPVYQVNIASMVQTVTGGKYGVVYTLWMAVKTSLANVYVQEVRLAILIDPVDKRITVPGDFRTTIDGSSRVTIRVL